MLKTFRGQHGDAKNFVGVGQGSVVVVVLGELPCGWKEGAVSVLDGEHQGRSSGGCDAQRQCRVGSSKGPSFFEEEAKAADDLSAGPSDGTAEFKVLEDGSVMAEIDIVRPRAFGLPGIMGSGYWKDKGHAGVSAGSGRDG